MGRQDDQRIHPSADPHPGKRGRSGMGSLIIALIIAGLVLVGFLVVEAGWREPPIEAVAPAGEPAETEAPWGTEPAEPAVPELASPDAPVETDPPVIPD